MASQFPSSGYILGLDVGNKRIGVAIASAIAKLPQPGDVVLADDKPIEKVKALIDKEDIRLVVVGLPRNMSGEETPQSAEVRKFSKMLSEEINLPIVFADESLSSVRADKLASHNNFTNVDQNSLAACFILEEYILNYNSQNEGDS